MQEPLNEVQDEYEEQVRLAKDSMISLNERGCDEILCQFMKDLDSSYDIDIEVEEEIEPNSHCNVNL